MNARSSFSLDGSRSSSPDQSPERARTAPASAGTRDGDDVDGAGAVERPELAAERARPLDKGRVRLGVAHRLDHHTALRRIPELTSGHGDAVLQGEDGGLAPELPCAPLHGEDRPSVPSAVEASVHTPRI